MAKVGTRTTEILILIGMAAAIPLGRSEPRDFVSSEIRRGFKKSMSCVQGGQLPSDWCSAFSEMIGDRTVIRTPAFLLGANFGFSFESEPAAENGGATPDQLRQVAACAVRARLAYEDLKRSLQLMDSDIITVLSINPRKFAAWKARASTRDGDHSATLKPGTDL